MIIQYSIFSYTFGHFKPPKQGWLVSEIAESTDKQNYWYTQFSSSYTRTTAVYARIYPAYISSGRFSQTRRLWSFWAFSPKFLFEGPEKYSNYPSRVIVLFFAWSTVGHDMFQKSNRLPFKDAKNFRFTFVSTLRLLKSM